MNEATASLLEDSDMGRDTRIEGLLSEWGLSWELEQAYPLGRLKIEDATQIRLKQHRAPADTVDQYVTHMKHGANFPPIVVGVNAMLVDGNARVLACEKLGRRTFAAYKVKFPHLGLAKIVAAALNQMGGDRLTEEEIVVAAEAMMAEGYPDEAIARTLGRSVSHIRNLRKTRLFEETVARLELGEIAVQIPKPVARMLAGIQHDQPFEAAVRAVAGRKPSAKAVGALIDQIDKTRSDADALAAIAMEHEKWGPLTGPPPHGKSATRSHGKQALALVHKLLEYGQDSPENLVLADKEAHEAWSNLNVLSTRVLALYAQAHG